MTCIPCSGITGIYTTPECLGVTPECQERERERRCIGNICGTDDDGIGGGGEIQPPPPTPSPTTPPITSAPVTATPTTLDGSYSPTHQPTPQPTRSPVVSPPPPPACRVSDSCNCSQQGVCHLYFFLSLHRISLTNHSQFCLQQNTIWIETTCLGGGYVAGNSTLEPLDGVAVGECALSYKGQFCLIL